jgi:hypothetical protein
LLEEFEAEGKRPPDFDISAIDELFRRSKELRTTQRFIDFINFIRKFRKYSMFNNAIVFLQNPNVTFYATRSHWWKKFERGIKENAQPMIILAPMTPILCVYNLEDTFGKKLPDYMNNPFETKGIFDENTLKLTVTNCKRDLIKVKYTQKSFLNAGCAIRYRFNERDFRGFGDIKVYIEINRKLKSPEKYATLCHELAHIHLGHLGNDKDEWWPDRRYLTRNQVELEAETTSYLVCSRAGLETKSAEYLSCYLKDERDLEAISIDCIIKTAGLIERMGEKLLPLRKKKTEKK